jgi:hypothetical protein
MNMPSSSLLSPTFIIGHIRIGSVEGASCVNFGNNLPTGFVSNKKHNQGFGTVGGDHNHIKDARSALNDSDLIDMFNDGDEIDGPPDWLRKIIADTISDEDEDENEEES